MGKKSIKENKNIYQTSREALNLTREKASELLETLSADRIEKIENEKSEPHPDEILRMAECYKNPSMCNYYCSHKCPIGQKYVPEIEMKELSQITLELLASLNSIEKEKEQLIEITVDGQITEDEYVNFVTIQEKLEQISITVKSLQLWMDHAIANGHIDKEKLSSVQNQLPSRQTVTEK